MNQIDKGLVVPLSLFYEHGDFRHFRGMEGQTTESQDTHEVISGSVSTGEARPFCCWGEGPAQAPSSDTSQVPPVASPVLLRAPGRSCPPSYYLRGLVNSCFCILLPPGH